MEDVAQADTLVDFIGLGSSVGIFRVIEDEGIFILRIIQGNNEVGGKKTPFALFIRAVGGDLHSYRRAWRA